MNLYSGATKISYVKNVNYDLDKTLFLKLINFYDILSNDMKDLIAPRYSACLVKDKPRLDKVRISKVKLNLAA